MMQGLLDVDLYGKYSDQKDACFASFLHLSTCYNCLFCLGEQIKYLWTYRNKTAGNK